MTGLPAAVFFDQDGTLVDTEPYWMASEMELSAAAGGTWTHEDAASIVGGPLESAGRALSQAGVPGTVHEIVVALVTKVVNHVRTDGVPWLPGVHDTFALLQSLDIPCAMVTSSWRILAQEVVDASEGALRFAVAGDEVENNKPDPEAYLKAADQMGVDIRDCVVFEDSPSGIGAALASGAHTVGIPCVSDIEPRPGLSRIASMAEVDQALLRRLMAGEVVDTVS